jgi:hypothetical protein
MPKRAWQQVGHDAVHDRIADVDRSEREQKRGNDVQHDASLNAGTTRRLQAY